MLKEGDRGEEKEEEEEGAAFDSEVLGFGEGDRVDVRAVL